MNKVLKWVAFTGLLLVALLASCFMAFESGQFYQRFYPEQLGYLQMGLVAAFLNEIFMAIMAGVWLPQLQFSRLSIVHPANFFFKFLLVLLFCVSVGGAAFHAVEPRITVLQKQVNEKSLITLLNKQLAQQKQNISTFSKQRQRLNTALSVKAQRETQQSVNKLLLRHKSTTVLWMEVTLMILLRIVVQMANLSSVWLAGWLYRSQGKVEISKKETSNKEESLTVQKDIEAQSDIKARQTEVRNKEQKQKNEKLLASKIKSTAGQKNIVDSIPKTTQQKNIVSSIPKTESQPTEHQATPTDNVAQIHRNTSAVNNSLNIAVVDEAKEKRKKMDMYVKSIHELFNQRSEGVTIADICRSIHENEAYVMNIISSKDIRFYKEIEAIYLKIKNLREQQLAIG